MAIAVTNHTAGGSGTDASSYNTASVTPTDGELQLLTVISREPANSYVPSPTGGGVTTWTREGSGAAINWSGGNDFRIDLFRAYQASYGAGAAIAIGYGGTMRSCDWTVEEASGIDTGGTNGADAVAQAVFNAVGSNDTTPEITLAALAGSDSMAVGAFASINKASGYPTTPTVATGFTILGTTTRNNAPSVAMISEYDLNVTAVGCTMGSTGADDGWCGVAVELVAASTSGAVSIAASLAGAGSLTATIGAVHPIASSLAGVGSFTASIGAIRPIAVSLAGAGSFTATIGAVHSIAASLAGVGSFTATIGAVRPIAVSLAGVGSFTATIGATRPIAASLAGVGSLTATVTDTAVAIAASLAGAGAMTAALVRVRTIEASLTGVATLTAALGRVTEIAASLAGAGSLTAALSVAKLLAAVLTGVGSLTAALLRVRAYLSQQLLASVDARPSLDADLPARPQLLADQAARVSLDADLPARATLAADQPSRPTLDADNG